MKGVNSTVLAAIVIEGKGIVSREIVGRLDWEVSSRSRLIEAEERMS